MEVPTPTKSTKRAFLKSKQASISKIPHDCLWLSLHYFYVHGNRLICKIVVVKGLDMHFNLINRIFDLHALIEQIILF